ncbi:MAG TPA: hypothetical protein VFL90_03585 [Methylomirabilota bacterium]|nr:hypothetical protein [Methylomirabilota bacterium]
MMARWLAIDVAWGLVAFCLWLPLIPAARRLRVPGAVAVAATAGWLAARLVLSALSLRFR